MSGTIDGISYASSKYVYDTHGEGFVTDILYYDQSAKQVADQTIFAYPPFTTSAPTHNADGTFSVTVTPPPGGHGSYPTYNVETFSSAGIWIREDVYSAVYKDPSNPSAGYSSSTETSQTLVNAVGPGSGGSINGAYYDEVMKTSSPGGQNSSINYYYDLGGSHQLVASYTPNPVIALAPNGTATAGTAFKPLFASLSDPWAAQNPGTLALNISVDAGTATGKDGNGNTFTATAGSAAHLTGTVAQINADLASLSFIDQSAGTAHLTVQVYDQAGQSANATETITVDPGSGSGSSPNPVIGGPATLTIPTGTALHGVSVTFSDPWAVTHAGSLALDVTTTLGTLTDTVGGHVTSGTSLNLTGSYAQIEADINGLALSSNQAGSGTVTVEIYDQAGKEAVHLIGVTAHA